MIQQMPVPPLFQTVQREIQLEVKTLCVLSPATPRPWGVEYWSIDSDWTQHRAKARTFADRLEAQAWLDRHAYLLGFQIVEVTHE